MASTLNLTAARRARRWLLALAISLVVIVFLVTVQRFLAVTEPLGHGVLVVEGWIPDSSFTDALEVFDRGAYTNLVIVGGSSQRLNVAQLEHRVSDKENSGAAITSSRSVVFLPVSAARNRTYATALTFRSWANGSGTPVHAVDVFTKGVHARKSWILFRKALGDRYQVGIISGPEHSFDPNRWFISRRGLWIVSRNLAGYAYFRVAILADNMGWKVLAD